MATRTLQTIGETAAQIRRCLAAPDEREALRWVAQFVAEFRRAPRADRPALVADEPPTTGDRRWDAMLAGVVEHLCFHHHLAVPAWALRPDRFLDRWWFVTPTGPCTRPRSRRLLPHWATEAYSFTARHWSRRHGARVQRATRHPRPGRGLRDKAQYLLELFPSG
jgi:hypothetical protein